MQCNWSANDLWLSLQPINKYSLKCQWMQICFPQQCEPHLDGVDEDVGGWVDGEEEVVHLHHQHHPQRVRLQHPTLDHLQRNLPITLFIQFFYSLLVQTMNEWAATHIIALYQRDDIKHWLNNGSVHSGPLEKKTYIKIKNTAKRKDVKAGLKKWIPESNPHPQRIRTQLSHWKNTHTQ